MRVAWVCLVIVSVGILGFGVITVLPTVAGGNLLIVANGLASIGLGLFGGLIVLIPFRRGERWAWSVLWFYPVFWVVHLIAELPRARTTSTRLCSSCSPRPVCYYPFET
jgi:hypothetical protein